MLANGSWKSFVASMSPVDSVWHSASALCSVKFPLEFLSCCFPDSSWSALRADADSESRPPSRLTPAATPPEPHSGCSRTSGCGIGSTSSDMIKSSALVANSRLFSGERVWRAESESAVASVTSRPPLPVLPDDRMLSPDAILVPKSETSVSAIRLISFKIANNNLLNNLWSV